MDHDAKIREHVSSPDEAAMSGLLKTYRLVLSKTDSATVAFSDPTELGRVRDNFVKKKLGVTDDNDSIDAAIKTVGAKMKSSRSKSRAAVYYLLADHYGKLDVLK